jgi:hypothetical protein
VIFITLMESIVGDFGAFGWTWMHTPLWSLFSLDIGVFDGDIWWMVMVDGLLTILGATFMPFDLWIMLEILRGG